MTAKAFLQGLIALWNKYKCYSLDLDISGRLPCPVRDCKNCPFSTNKKAGAVNKESTLDKETKEYLKKAIKDGAILTNLNHTIGVVGGIAVQETNKDKPWGTR